MALKRVCDVCRTEKDVITTSITYDRKLDAAGSLDDEYMSYDICYKCYSNVLKTALYEMGYDCCRSPYEIGEYIIDNIKDKI